RAAGHAAAGPVAVPAAGRPARHGQEPDRARDRPPAVDAARPGDRDARGEPFYGYAEMSGGPSSDEFTFRYEYVPDSEHPGDVRLIPAAFVEAMQHGWVVMIDEVNTIRDVALLSLNGTLDGRLSLYLPAEGRTVTARPGFAVLIAYNLVLVGASNIPDA